MFVLYSFNLSLQVMYIFHLYCYM